MQNNKSNNGHSSVTAIMIDIDDDDHDEIAVAIPSSLSTRISSIIRTSSIQYPSISRPSVLSTSLSSAAAASLKVFKGDNDFGSEIMVQQMTPFIKSSNSNHDVSSNKTTVVALLEEPRVNKEQQKQQLQVEEEDPNLDNNTNHDDAVAAFKDDDNNNNNNNNQMYPPVVVSSSNYMNYFPSSSFSDGDNSITALAVTKTSSLEQEHEQEERERAVIAYSYTATNSTITDSCDNDDGARLEQIELSGEARKQPATPREKKSIVKQKKYVDEPTDIDVLTERGKHFHRHPGNMRFREEMKRVREQHTTTENEEDKKIIIETLVRCIQSNGGNFLEKDEKGWYIIDNPDFIHRKICEAFINTKEQTKRKPKRRRFLVATQRAPVGKAICVSVGACTLKSPSDTSLSCSSASSEIDEEKERETKSVNDKESNQEDRSLSNNNIDSSTSTSTSTSTKKNDGEDGGVVRFSSSSTVTPPATATCTAATTTIMRTLVDDDEDVHTFSLAPTLTSSRVTPSAMTEEDNGADGVGDDDDTQTAKCHHTKLDQEEKRRKTIETLTVPSPRQEEKDDSDTLAATTMSCITDPQETDVLCGRGGAAMRHPGNQIFRKCVNLNKKTYFNCEKTEKMKISRSIVAAIRKQGGRFLEQRDINKKKVWVDIGDKKAGEKTSQALRERQQDILCPMFQMGRIKVSPAVRQVPLMGQYGVMSIGRKKRIIDYLEKKRKHQGEDQSTLQQRPRYQSLSSSSSSSSSSPLSMKQQQQSQSHPRHHHHHHHYLLQVTQPSLMQQQAYKHQILLPTNGPQFHAPSPAKKLKMPPRTTTTAATTALDSSTPVKRNSGSVFLTNCNNSSQSLTKNASTTATSATTTTTGHLLNCRKYFTAKGNIPVETSVMSSLCAHDVTPTGQDGERAANHLLYPHEIDVVLCDEAWKYPGNQSYLESIRINSLTGFFDSEAIDHQIACTIVDNIRRRGGSFLSWSNPTINNINFTSSGSWQDIGDESAIELTLLQLHRMHESSRRDSMTAQGSRERY